MTTETTTKTLPNHGGDAHMKEIGHNRDRGRKRKKKTGNDIEQKDRKQQQWRW